MCTSVFTFPRPVNSEGNSVLKSACWVVTSPISSSVQEISPNATQAFLLSSGQVWSGTTHTGSVTFLRQYERLAWNMPMTGIWIFPGPRKVCFGLTNFWSFSHVVCPVSSLMQVFWPLTPSCTVQSPPVVWILRETESHLPLPALHLLPVPILSLLAVQSCDKQFESVLFLCICYR